MYLIYQHVILKILSSEIFFILWKVVVIPFLLSNKNDVIVSDDPDKATIYNKYFHSIFTIDDCNNISYLCQSLEYHPDLVDSIDFSVEEVHSELLNLQWDKACGPDHIPVYLLRKGPDFLAPSH